MVFSSVNKFLLLFVVLIFASSPLMAQDPVYIANERGSQLIDSTMAMMNIRAERFNEEIGKVNALKALEVASLEKNIIPKNVQKIKDFLAYLDLYRSLSEQLMQATRDSLEK